MIVELNEKEIAVLKEVYDAVSDHQIVKHKGNRGTAGRFYFMPNLARALEEELDSYEVDFNEADGEISIFNPNTRQEWFVYYKRYNVKSDWAGPEGNPELWKKSAAQKAAIEDMEGSESGSKMAAHVHQFNKVGLIVRKNHSDDEKEKYIDFRNIPGMVAFVKQVIGSQKSKPSKEVNKEEVTDRPRFVPQN